MGQNSDIHNIFESYSKKVLLKEQQLSREKILALKDKANRIKDPAKKQVILDEITKGSAAPSTSPAPQPAGTPAPQAAAPTKTDPKAEYNKQLQRTPGDYDPDSFENVDKPMNSQNPNLAKAREIKKGILAGNNAAPQAAAGDISADPLVAQAKMEQGKEAIKNLTPAGRAEQFYKAGEPNPSFKEYQQGNADEAEKKLGLPSGPTVDAAKEQNAAVDAAKKQDAKPADSKGGKTSGSSGGSIVDYLAGKNQKFDKASRAELAAQYGIQNYTGTAQQNADLLNKLKANEKMPQGTNATGEQQYAAGTVPKATANDSQQQPQQQQQQGMGGIIGGASKLAGGAGNLAKKALVGDQPLGGIVGGVSKLAGGAGNLVKKALIGGGGQQQAAPVQQQQATATTQQTAPVQQAAPVQQTASTKKQVAPTKQTAPSQQTASNYKKTPGDASEFFKDQSDEEIKENKNIAKFVKCLSEKNYSQAHEYLKKIVNSKVEKNLYRVINKL